MFSPSSLNGRLLCTADYNFVCRSNWTCMWANCKWDDFQALNSADDKNIKMLMIVFCYGRPLNSNVYIYDINPRTSNCEAVRCRQNRSSRLNCFKVASIFEKLVHDYIVLNILIIILMMTNSKITNRCSCIEKLFGAYQNPKWFSLACLTFYLKRQRRLMGGPHDLLNRRRRHPKDNKWSTSSCKAFLNSYFEYTIMYTIFMRCAKVL